jgi:predicted  nucleic acid-binding Zn-ribbon protein
MNPNRTGRAEVRMESKRVVVDLQQLDLLESKIVKATELIRSLRKERDQAQGRAKDLEKSLAAAQAQIHASERGKDELREITEQVDTLREERQAIRGRVSQMIEMMNGLEDGGESRRDH